MKTLNILLTLAASFSMLSLRAQLPEQGGALLESDLPAVSLGVRAADFRRRVKDGDTSIRLETPRVVVAAQFPLAPGFSPWVEAGWHEPDLSVGTNARGGFTWGLGASIRPWRFAIRSDPETGPRDWLALKVDASYRTGSASAAGGAGDIDWSLLEGKFGVEWRQVIFGAREGPMNSTGMTVGAGLVLNSLEADKPGFNGSEANGAGFYVQTLFNFGPSSFLGIEADWYGGSDRRLALVTGLQF